MIKTVYKNESLFMKILSVILFFNSEFMTSYATTIGETVYLPESAKKYSSKELEILLSHEMVHILDYKKNKVLFVLKYLFPQIIFPLTFLILPFSLTLSIFLFIFSIFPFPAYWRMKYELRGYTMTLAVKALQFKNNGYADDVIRGVINKDIDRINTYFKGSSYYFMWPFGIYDKIEKNINSIISGDIFNSDESYEEIRKTILCKYH
jgi:ABC-type multidrug transport system fused ATPase/permease subunit